MKYKIFLFVFSASFYSTNVFAQSPEHYIGTWEGKLNVGVEFRAVFHIKADGKGGLVSTTDSPDQAVFGIVCDTTFLSDKGITIQVLSINGTYTGKLINDSTLLGILTQGKDFPLTLKKLTKGMSPALIRPQLPVPPFPYESYDVEYDNTDKSVHFGATLTVPRPDPNIRYIKAPEYPVAILITGSGQQDRDESLMGHKPFAVIADHLTRQGYAVLRVDDRGTGKTTGDLFNATTADFAKDVETSIDYLKTRTEIDKNKIGLVGHSEGGMIAPMIASKRNDINFIILLAGPGIKIIDLMGEQNGAILRSQGIAEPVINSFVPLYKKTVMEIIKGKDSSSAKNNAMNAMMAWSQKTETTIKETLGFKDAASMRGYIDQLYPTITSPWFRYFILFDPQPYLQKLSCKVLALNGSRDIQVISKSNLAGIQSSLKKAKVMVGETKELPGLNHLFQHCKKCTVNEYREIEETFSPEALKIMSDWLNKNVK